MSLDGHCEDGLVVEICYPVDDGYRSAGPEPASQSLQGKPSRSLKLHLRF